MNKFLANSQPIKIPAIYDREYHRISREKISTATGSKLLMNIINNNNKI
jgi:hypothetical protein